MATHVFRTIAGEANFTAWCREHAVLFGDVALGDLIDIELRFHTGPTVQPTTPGAAFVGVEDLRLHINRNDVTPDLLAELRRLIAIEPADQVKERYLEGVEHYLAFIRAFGSHSQQVKDDDEYARLYAESGPWADKLETLGDRKVGWSGNLHLVNYLYRAIALRPVSLASVWRRFVQKSGSPLPAQLSRLQDLSILFSQGPAPSYQPIDPQFISGGQLRYQLDIKTENPLKSSLTQILARLQSLQRGVEALRTVYLQPLQGEVQSLSTEVSSGNSSLAEALDRLKTTVENIAGP